MSVGFYVGRGLMCLKIDMAETEVQTKYLCLTPKGGLVLGGEGRHGREGQREIKR